VTVRQLGVSCQSSSTAFHQELATRGEAPGRVAQGDSAPAESSAADPVQRLFHQELATRGEAPGRVAQDDSAPAQSSAADPVQRLCKQELAACGRGPAPRRVRRAAASMPASVTGSAIRQASDKWPAQLRSPFQPRLLQGVAAGVEALSLADRSFCRLGLAGEVPSHSTVTAAPARAICCGGSSRGCCAAA
jgi:hypothetical protein